MSEFDETYNNGQQSIRNYDTSKIFIWANEFQSESYQNGTGAEITLATGTVMGRVNASGLVDALQAAATDGSQYPLGILAKAVTVANGATAAVSICIAGHVDESKVVLVDDYTDLDSEVDGRLLRDRIAADTKGIKLVTATELTAEDNQLD
jgi:hypothetical protein